MSQRNTADDLGTIRPMFRVDEAAMGDILDTGERSLPYLLILIFETIIPAKSERGLRQIT